MDRPKRNVSKPSRYQTTSSEEESIQIRPIRDETSLRDINEDIRQLQSVLQDSDPNLNPISNPNPISNSITNSSPISNPNLNSNPNVTNLNINAFSTIPSTSKQVYLQNQYTHNIPISIPAQHIPLRTHDTCTSITHSHASTVSHTDTASCDNTHATTHTLLPRHSFLPLYTNNIDAQYQGNSEIRSAADKEYNEVEEPVRGSYHVANNSRPTEKADW